MSIEDAEPPNSFQEEHPDEVVIAFVYVVGTACNPVLDYFENTLKQSGYVVVRIKPGDLLEREGEAIGIELDLKDDSYFDHVFSRMEAGKRLCEYVKRPDFIGLACVKEINRLRIDARGRSESQVRTAYLVTSVKRPEEVDLMRDVYGSGFFLVGIHAPEQELLMSLTGKSGIAGETQARQLIESDLTDTNTFGHNARDTYALSDLFLSQSIDECRQEVERFVDLAFAKNIPHQPEETRFDPWVYLTCLDEVESHGERYQIVCAILLRQDKSDLPEDLLAGVIEEAVPESSSAPFEFHAADLYESKGRFAGLPRARAIETLESCVRWIADCDIPIVFGAVDTMQHSGEDIRGKAHPAGDAFTICAKGAELWMHENAKDQLGILIVDSSASPEVRQAVQRSFRDLTRHVHALGSNRLVLKHFSDDLYFGDSACSFGIQLADICCFFIDRHINGDPDTEHFYSMIEPNIINSQVVRGKSTLMPPGSGVDDHAVPDPTNPA